MPAGPPYPPKPIPKPGQDPDDPTQPQPCVRTHGKEQDDEESAIVTTLEIHGAKIANLEGRVLTLEHPPQGTETSA